MLLVVNKNLLVFCILRLRRLLKRNVKTFSRNVSIFNIYKNLFLQDIQDYLDSSVNGAVYFSLGTHILSTSLANETLKNIIEVFSELPYNVLWKWEKDTLPGKPPNVLIRKFFPQQDLLGI